MTDESKKDISISSGDVHPSQDLSSEESDSDLSLREDLGEQLRLAEERACDFSDEDGWKDYSEDQPARDVYKNITIETVETIETTIEMDMESDDDEKIYGGVVDQNISAGDVLVVKGEPVLVDQAKALVRSSSSGIGAVILFKTYKMFSLSAATVSEKRMLSGEKGRRLVKARKREESSEVDVFVENEWRLSGELDKARKRDDLEEGNREIDLFVAKLRGEFEEDFHDFQDY